MTGIGERKSESNSIVGCGEQTGCETQCEIDDKGSFFYSCLQYRQILIFQIRNEHMTGGMGDHP